MNKQELKKKIVDTCILTLENSVLTVRESIDELIQTANDYEGDHDILDPFKEGLIKKKDLQLKQLQNYQEDIKLVKKADPKRISELVEFGSVVITDKQRIFIAAGIGKIVLDNETYYAISTQVPVYMAMKGLKVGESFTINNNKFTIKDIF
jgi:hypothetical protein